MNFIRVIPFFVNCRNMGNHLEIEIEDIPESVADLVEIIGLQRLIQLSKHIGGSSVYIPKYERLSRMARNRMVRMEFNGQNHKELAVKYNLSVAGIRGILNGNI